MKLFVGIGRMGRMAMILDSWRFRESVQIVESISSDIQKIGMSVRNSFRNIQIKDGLINANHLYKLQHLMFPTLKSGKYLGG